MLKPVLMYQALRVDRNEAVALFSVAGFSNADWKRYRLIFIHFIALITLIQIRIFVVLSCQAMLCNPVPFHSSANPATEPSSYFTESDPALFQSLQSHPILNPGNLANMPNPHPPSKNMSYASHLPPKKYSNAK
jgi:hypothetical protein